MVRNNNRRSDRDHSQFNRLHDIIARREAREGLLQSSFLHQSAIFQQTLANAQYLDSDRPSLYVVHNNILHFQPVTLARSATHLNQRSPTSTTPFLPSFHHPNIPASFTQLHDNNNIPSLPPSLPPSSLNSGDNNLLTSVPGYSLPPPPGTHPISLPSDSSSVIVSQVEQLLQNYRTSTEFEPLPPRFNPNNAPPSNILHPSYPSSPSSQPPSHQAFIPSQQHWSHAD